MQTSQRATLDDLLAFDGKAELIGGRIVPLMASGRLPTRVAFKIAMSLHAHTEITGRGEVAPDGLGYSVPELPSGRESFEPDASYYEGPFPANEMRFIEGAPAFAVEVRSEHDYGPSRDIEVEKKREDYFAAGTLVVWDVDPLAKEIRCYRRHQPDQATVFRPGEVADAEPAVPGWVISVDKVFA